MPFNISYSQNTTACGGSGSGGVGIRSDGTGTGTMVRVANVVHRRQMDQSYATQAILAFSTTVFSSATALSPGRNARGGGAS